MPDEYGFNHLGNILACIHCDVRDNTWNLPIELRETHSRLHIVIKNPEIQTLICHNCGIDFERESKRGRAPRFCESCFMLDPSERGTDYAPVQPQEAFSANSNKKARASKVIINTGPKYRINDEGLRVEACRSCGNDFAQIIKRGKPVQFCKPCKEGKIND